MMSAKFLFFVVASFLFFQATLAGKAKKETAPKPNEIDEASQKVTTFLTDFGNSITALAGAKDAETAQGILHNNTLKFVDSLADLAKNLQVQMGSLSGDASTAVGKMVAKLNATAADLQNQFPEANKSFKEYSEKMQEGFQTVVKETDKVVKTLGDNAKDMQDDIAKLTKKAYDQVLESAQVVQKQMHEAANKA